MDILKIIGRDYELFCKDISSLESELSSIIKNSRFLIIGAAGSIGQAVTFELMKRDPKVLHAVDISENNMVELVRTIRSSIGYESGDFKTFALDCGSHEFHTMYEQKGPYDYVFNLSAIKHVRSEKDPFTLMRMIRVNILNTIATVNLARSSKANNYFCVSTDKAANPANMMGASKRIMELFLARESSSQKITMARFANVAFSDGSLLHGFNQRILKRQPLTAPNDIRRYFVTPKEAGELCLLAGIFGENRDTYFPKLSEKLHLESFSKIADRYLLGLGYQPYYCESEQQARLFFEKQQKTNFWPVYYFSSNTTGEKPFEEFYTSDEEIDWKKYDGIGVIKNKFVQNDDVLDEFLEGLTVIEEKKIWEKSDFLELFQLLLPNFEHLETGRNLDNRM